MATLTLENFIKEITEDAFTSPEYLHCEQGYLAKANDTYYRYDGRWHIYFDGEHGQGSSLKAAIESAHRKILGLARV